MEKSEFAEELFANTYISIERIRQAADFLVSEHEQYIMFGIRCIVKVQKTINHNLKIQVQNIDTNKVISRVIAFSELENSNFDLLTHEIIYIFNKLGYKI